MSSNDSELVYETVEAKPGLTAREISRHLRGVGHAHFTSKVVNQSLYRMLNAQILKRDASGEKPKWFIASRIDRQSVQPPRPKRPLDPTDLEIRRYQIASTEVRVLLDDEMSPNDPYITPDWVGSHVISSINTRHPFWSIRLDSASDRALFCVLAAVDAYVQWKIAKLTESPDSSEVQAMRDYALRFCTLTETEITRND